MTTFVISGATGLIGRTLIKDLSEKYDAKIIVLTRNKDKIRKIDWQIKEKTKIIPYLWDEKEKIISEAKEGENKIVINLAGENIGQRWTEKLKEKIEESRIESTRETSDIAEKINANLFISASAVGYYGDRGDENLDEKSGPGNLFLSKVCVKWENEAQKSAEKGIKTIITRIGVVLSKDAKFIKSLLTPLFIANPFGKGENFISWIHIKDLTRALLFLIELDKKKKNKSGKERESAKVKIVNITSPQPVKSKEIVNILAEIKNKKVVNLPQKILSLMLGKDFVRETITPSQKVYPKVLISEGFEFLFPDIKKALEDIAK
jgi:uncharacterized protein (TIGR01777 family)